jgi:pyruvate kinase
MRHAKIVCTMGPASSDDTTIKKMLKAGMNCARLNFSHGTHDSHKKMYDRIRKVAKASDRSVAILQDLQGPKIRSGLLERGVHVNLINGEKIWITTKEVVGTADRISTGYKNIVKDVSKGSRVLIDDGRLELKVLKIDKDQFLCEVIVGGELGQNKGINLPGVDVSAPSVSKRDFNDLEFGLKLGVDFVALSFVRKASDIQKVRKFIGDKSKHVKIIAKIERPEAIENLESILDASDGVMVARGDLGVETNPHRVAILQKEIIKLANQKNKFVITATHMLDSMVNNPRPTRAEVSDVSNAIYDGSDAVMLSGETASGKYPVQTVQFMSDIIGEVELDIIKNLNHRRPSSTKLKMTPQEALVHAACSACIALRGPCMSIYTRSGQTAWNIANGRPYTRIVAFTTEQETYQSLSMAWGVHPVKVKIYKDLETLYTNGMKAIKERGLAKKGETVVMIAGTSLARGSSNTISFRICG